MSDSLTVFGTDYTGVTGIKAKGTGNGMLTYIRPTGTKSISENGTGIDVAAYSLVDVAVSGGGGDSYTRTVVVPQQTVTVSGSTYTADNITMNSTLVVGDYYIVTLDGTEYVSTCGANWAGETYLGDSGMLWYDGSGDGTNYSCPFAFERISWNTGGSLHATSGSHTVKVEHLEFVDGPLNLITKSITSNGTYNASSDNADGYSSVTVNVPSSGSTDFVVTMSYNSSTGMWEPDCTYAEVSAAMGSGKSLSAKITSGVNGAADAEWNSNSNTMLYAVFVTNSVAWYQYVYSLTAQGISLVYQGTANRYTLTVNSSGRWEAAQFNAYGFDVVNVPDGTAGTPTATKGNVSNHSISVTPSVTNTDGWITGGTKTGTAVTVSASELVSGNKAITENGNNIDVTNYATVSVNVPSGGSSMNVQTAQSTTRVANTAYTKTASLTCAVSGTYDVYWDCFRSTTSGTSGSQLYIGGTASGSANTTFSNHAQNNHRTGVHINANQEVAVYVRSRATNYYAYCGQLTIVQTA